MTLPRETTEFIYVFESFNHMADEVEASHEKDMKMVQAELDNLRLQVNSHMLLNSFNTIFSLAQSKNTALIQDFSLYLVDYFRYVLRETADLVPLEKEMAFVESYTGIQKIRFPNRFTSVTNITEEAKKALLDLHCSCCPETPKGARSDCHAWSALPLYVLPKA